MEVKNMLARNLETAGREGVSLDSSCKKLLANKVILAWILQNCVEEYGGFSREEIEKFIEGVPNVSQEAVHQDETVMIKGGCNEDSSMTEGTITYDIRFNAIAPCPIDNRNRAVRFEKKVRLGMDIEGQTDFYPGYPLSKRGIYYGSRMISSQYGRVFNNSHYEKIEKVYSIWICINPPRYRRNSVNLYKFHEEQLYGEVKEKKENYDLITIVMICLGDEDAKEYQGLLRLLSVLFSAKKSVNEKMEILRAEFGIAMTQKLESEVKEMCNYSKYVIEKGLEIGIKQGREEGLKQGIEEGIFNAVRNLLKNTNMTLEQVMKALEIPEAEKDIYVDKLNLMMEL